MTLVATETDTTLDSDPDWWRHAVVYQVYPRSFADGNGDGVGDFRGVISRVPYLSWLGVDAVWFSPFYPSALADGGYDVDDYRDVDPRVGTLTDFDELVAALHEAGIRVVVDIVPNHTSNRHEWFREALASPAGSPARARYIFRDGKGEHGELPPNQWPSIFGGPGWERITEPDGTPGQWYLHMFAAEQPDLNWDNPEVPEDFLRTLRFWADRGVDGFRVDVAHALKKNLDPAFDAIAKIFGTESAFADGQHPLFDRDAVHEIYAQWRAVFDEYDPPRAAVAEAWVQPHRRARYASPQGLGQVFNFELMWAGFDAKSYRDTIDQRLRADAEAGASSTWVFSNHDVARHATRFAFENDAATKAWVREGGDPAAVDAELGLRRARAATLLMLALPGSAYLYQGEELGLPEVGDLPADQRQDPSFFRSGGDDFGRDGCRVPLPWTAEGRSFGFGDAGAHIAQPASFARYAVAAQRADPASTLSLYRRAIELRRQLQTEPTLRWHDVEGDVLHFERPGGWHVVTNFGGDPVALPAGEVLIASAPLEGNLLPPETTVWLRMPQP